MIPWNVEFTDRAQADLAKLAADDRNAVMSGIYRYAHTGQGDLKKLQGYHPPRWRLRVGKWRVFHHRDDANHTLVIHRVKDRKDAY